MWSFIVITNRTSGRATVGRRTTAVEAAVSCHVRARARCQFDRTCFEIRRSCRTRQHKAGGCQDLLMSCAHEVVHSHATINWCPCCYLLTPLSDYQRDQDLDKRRGGRGGGHRPPNPSHGATSEAIGVPLHRSNRKRGNDGPTSLSQARYKRGVIAGPHTAPAPATTTP